MTPSEAVCGCEAMSASDGVMLTILVVVGIATSFGFGILAAATAKLRACGVCDHDRSKFCVDKLCVKHCDAHHSGACYRAKLPDAGGKERAA